MQQEKFIIYASKIVPEIGNGMKGIFLFNYVKKYKVR